ncbi:unnamed protein product [Phytophthora lilii]|uniref:Unnamed protein product n=1 Tax=Phytophthora lilii TaxID=2077276 RepID=A0A9W6XQY2_9STRA|nr:unnamed protein product [Phytophthora lilii]
MFAYELERLKRSNIQAIKWGSSYRVKVRGRTGKMVYVSNVSRNVSRPINQRLVAKQYNVSTETLEKHLSPDYKADPKNRFYNGNHMQSHLYEGVEATDFYYKLENILSTQASAFKVSSGYKLKAITAFKIFIYHREHSLGDSEAVIPKIIRENKHVINFPKTNNKCVFHCIAWHTFQSPKKDPRRIQAQVKEAFKRYCSFKWIKYSLSLFRSFKPIELLQPDEVEDCFQHGINVYKMDVVSGNVECIRRSDKGYEDMDILSHENHALYIKNIDMLQSKYQCPKCEMLFVSGERLKITRKISASL